jgi:hypothetical protein
MVPDFFLQEDCKKCVHRTRVQGAVMDEMATIIQELLVRGFDDL